MCLRLRSMEYQQSLRFDRSSNRMKLRLRSLRVPNPALSIGHRPQIFLELAARSCPLHFPVLSTDRSTKSLHSQFISYFLISSTSFLHKLFMHIKWGTTQTKKKLMWHGIYMKHEKLILSESNYVYIISRLWNCHWELRVLSHQIPTNHMHRC